MDDDVDDPADGVAEVFEDVLLPIDPPAEEEGDMALAEDAVAAVFHVDPAAEAFVDPCR